MTQAVNDKVARLSQRHLIGAIDQGTSSTRFLVFESGSGQLVASSQIEIKRIIPQEGWVEMDPDDIMKSVYDTISNVSQQLHQCNGAKELNKMIDCIGICNQRESTVVWDSVTGRPLYNVILWMDNRTKDIVDEMVELVPGRDFNCLKDKTGLPMSTYFSAFKLRWLIDNVEQVKYALDNNTLLFGTVDSWILWNLTGKHFTDVTNASRTFLMDLESLKWDTSLCEYFKIPTSILPQILSSADDFGIITHGPLESLPVTGVIGDQSAALFGHHCLITGQTKATFGTGCFIMQNLGPAPLAGALSDISKEAKKGLITTVGYKIRGRPACYALEGSIKIAGAAITWLRDNLQLISNYAECDELINKTTNSRGAFFVPALGGLYSPYWDPNAAGLFIGLSQFTRREHLVRATFDSIAFQTNDILSLMRNVANGLMIDGGLCASENICQILADITGYDIVRPSMCETSALGAAMVAGCGHQIWDFDTMINNSCVSMDAQAAASSNHHYPHESLNYEDKYASIMETKRRKLSSNCAVIEKDDRAELKNLASPVGVNDDAGGGSYSTSSGEEDDEDYEEIKACNNNNNTNTPISNTSVNMINNPQAIDCIKRTKYANTSSTDNTSGYGDSVTSCGGVVRQDSPESGSPSPIPQHDVEAEALRTPTRSITKLMVERPVDVFQPYISLEHRNELVDTWHRAVRRSMQWTQDHPEQLRRDDNQRMLPVTISMYLLFSVGMFALSKWLRV